METVFLFAVRERLLPEFNKEKMFKMQILIFFGIFLKKLRKKIDFLREKYYTVTKWSKMVVKWSKREG